MRRFDVLLCDADNTLFDFDACEKVALRRACAALALPCDEAICRVYAQINAALWAAYERNEMTQVALRRVRFTQLLAHLHAVADADALGKAYTDALGQTALMIPGALEMVRQVAAWMPIYLFTNGIGSVQRSRLAASPLSDWIAGMVISEEVGVAKPDPRMVEAAMAQAGVRDRARVLVVGDSLKADIACACAAGVHSCWYNPAHATNDTPFRPDWEIDAWEALPPLLEMREMSNA